ncbi:GreA/GreB family elongation factor, partial [Patescibacteria group bacterium]|nr:GreA/GreB family elongation factor [Patescibacteria group bacterium]
LMTEKTIPITKFGFDVLSKRQKELISVINKKRTKDIESQRKVNAAKTELSEIEAILNESFVRPFDEKNPAQVQIGCTVNLENLSTGDKREYTILSRTTADPLKGIISNESPLAQKMIGLKLGNTFKFKNNYGQEESYKVYSIE